MGKAKAKQVTENNRPAIIACLGLIAIFAASVHWPVLSSQAHCFDDNEFVTENPLVRNPSLGSVARFSTEVLEPSTVHGYYAPLTMVSLMLDYGLGARPEDLTQFHRTNLMLHVLNALAVFAFFFALMKAPIPALLVALLFAAHPLSVEPVAWIAERKTLLATFFSLVALLFYVRANERNEEHWRWAALGAFTLGCLAKPTAVVLPALMLVLDYWPLQRLNRKAIVEKIPFYVLAIVFAAVTLVSHQRTVGIEAPAGGVLTSVLTAGYLVAFYLGKVIWPSDLTPVYLLPDPLSLSNPVVAAGCTVSVALAIAVVWLARRGTPAPLAGALFFVLALAPTLGGLRYSWVTASDKYAYLPLIGLGLIGSWWVALIWNREGEKSILAKTAVVSVVVILGASEAVATREQLERWRNTESLYKYMLSFTPDVSLLHANLGESYWQDGKVEDARRSFHRALENDPNSAKAHNNLGVLLWSTNRHQQGFEHLTKAVAADPDLATAHRNLGIALNGMGRFEDAIAEFDRALAIDDTDAQTHCGMALSLSQLGRTAKARAHYTTSLRLMPGCALPPGALP